MAGKIVPLVISGILLFSISVPLCFADEDAEINKQKENILSLIEAGKFSEAKAATEKMTIEFPGLAKLPDMLYWIARRYQHFDRFEDSKQIYEQVIKDFPDSPWAKKAKMGYAMTEAISLVVSGKFAEAKTITDKMAADFAGNPDLAETLYWISGRFQAFDRFEDAKQICEQIIKDYPESPWAKKARMSKAMSEAMALIISGKYAEANEATVQMVADFARSPDSSAGANLPEMLYWIAERYERAGRSDDAKRDYQRLIDLFPNNPLAKKAKLGIPRAEVIGLVVAEDFNNAGLALNKMTADFASHPDLPETLYWLAYRYNDIGRLEDANSVYQQVVQSYPDNMYARKVATEKKIVLATEGTENTEKKIIDINTEAEKAAIEVYRIARGYEEVNDFDSAAKAYEQVVKDYPATIKGENAVLDIRRLEILNALDSNDTDYADALLAQFVEDFNQNLYAGDCLELLVDKCYWNGFQLMRQSKYQKAMSRFAFAEEILQIIIDKKTAGNSAIGTTHTFAALYYYAAGCRQQQGNWDGAIKYFHKTIENGPMFQYTWNAQAAIGWCYEALARSEKWPKEAALPLIEEAYKAVLDKYPNGNMAYYAAYRLGELSIEKGDKAGAITYYRKYLEKAHPQDTRIETIKAKLTTLEEENK
jgi:TolA-binding protein